MIEAQFDAVAAVRAARSALRAGGDRDGGAPALSRAAGICRGRHLRPPGGPGRRRADADLQLARGPPRAVDGRRAGRHCCARSKAPRTRSGQARAPCRRSCDRSQGRAHCGGGERHDAVHSGVPARGQGARRADRRDREQPRHAAARQRPTIRSGSTPAPSRSRARPASRPARRRRSRSTCCPLS